VVWPSEAAEIGPVAEASVALADHAKEAPVTVVGAATANMLTPPFGATLAPWVCAEAATQEAAATVAPQFAAVVMGDQPGGKL
jgi:hypothetical protein